jgi:archaellum component FlaC
MFDPTPQGTTDPNLAGSITDIQTAMTNLQTEATRILDPLKEIPNQLNKITIAAETLNKEFIGSRTRINEMMQAIADVSPEVIGLGGKFEDVGKTIDGIAKGSRRNLIASKEDIQELFATSKVIGQDVTKLVDEFAKVGIMYSDISEKVVDSISYVNSIGVNASTVMKDVVSNTDKLSRFNFEGGVQGLTKMAAQASMLRFDMKETFELADKVLDPDKAIEVASAFQRLGVSAGNLTDPFMLMNQSINDPSGLQNSLINVAKQFTYFDESAQQFKISPQGILTLREMEAQTGVSAKSMREAALSAADFDKRIGDIKKTGLAAGFSEDDQMLIANLSRMNKEKGGYEIKVVDDKGQESYKKLTDLSSEQLKATLEAEKDRPKDIEAVQRSQLNTQESMLQNLKEINEKILRGITGNQTAIRSVAKGSDALRGGVRKGTETYFNQDFQDTMEKLEKKLASTTDPTKRKEVLDELKGEAMKMGGDVLDGFTDMLGKLKGGSLPINDEKINQLFSFFEESAKKTKIKKVGPSPLDLGGAASAGTKINTDFLFGSAKAAETIATGKGRAVGGGGASVTETIEVKPISGKIDINVTATGADSKIIEEILSKGSVTLKERIFEIVTEQSKITPGRIR